MWKNLEEFDGRYKINENGDVFTNKNKRLLTNGYKHDYAHVGLIKNSKYRYFKVSRLVAKYFVPNKDGKPFVNHIDGNKKNDNFKNLEWVTQSENVLHAYKNGLTKNRTGKGIKLTTSDVDKIRKLRRDGLLLSQIAGKFSISEAWVSNIVNNKKYL